MKKEIVNEIQHKGTGPIVQFHVDQTKISFENDRLSFGWALIIYLLGRLVLLGAAHILFACQSINQCKPS